MSKVNIKTRTFTITSDSGRSIEFSEYTGELLVRVQKDEQSLAEGALIDFDIIYAALNAAIYSVYTSSPPFDWDDDYNKRQEVETKCNCNLALDVRSDRHNTGCPLFQYPKKKFPIKKKKKTKHRSLPEKEQPQWLRDCLGEEAQKTTTVRYTRP